MQRPLDQVLTVARMQAAEQALVDAGTPVEELMQRAGEGAAEWVWRMAAGRSVTVLCGPGNNGGDGYVIAERLRLRGLEVRVVAPFAAKGGAAASARAAWQGQSLDSGNGVHGDVLVDCLFGYGLTRGLDGQLCELVHGLAMRHHRCIAVDVPSGIASDSGELLSKVPHYDLTLALGAWKQAHMLMPGRATMGEMRLVDIGIGRVEGAGMLAQRPHFGAPAADAHKYRRGLVAVIAGRMPGAAMLASEAAMRGGAGYVKLLSDHAHHDAPSGLVVDDTPLQVALADGRIAALLTGPGLGRGDIARDQLAFTLESAKPMVLDADALHLLDPDMLEGVDTSRTLITPHEGELAALCDVFGVAVTGKLEKALALAERTGLTVLAKGPDSILCAAGEPAIFFPAATSWLSVAGSGDVLAGIAASRLATGASPKLAALEAVWLHGEAARLAGPAFTADDLAQKVSKAYAQLQ